MPDAPVQISEMSDALTEDDFDRMVQALKMAYPTGPKTIIVRRDEAVDWEKFIVEGQRRANEEFMERLRREYFADMSRERMKRIARDYWFHNLTV